MQKKRLLFKIFIPSFLFFKKFRWKQWNIFKKYNAWSIPLRKKKCWKSLFGFPEIFWNSSESYRKKKEKVQHHIDFYYFETISHPKILRVLWFLFQACCCNQKKDKQKASKQSEVWSNFSFFHRIHIHLLIKRRRKIQLKG